jgi:HK97 gp10 family phage protein
MTIVIEGVEDIQKILDEIAPKHARNLMRTTIHGVASEITKLAKKKVPKKTGNLKKAIKTKRKKSHPDKPVSQVYITTGRSAKYDGFYWRFVEYRTGGKTAQKARPFIRPASDYVRANFNKILKNQFGKKLERKLASEAKKGAKL